MTDQLLAALALCGLVIVILVSGPTRRLNQGAVLVGGALLVGLIVLAMFFGPAGWVSGLVCGGAVLAAGLALYGLLVVMERWAKGGDD